MASLRNVAWGAFLFSGILFWDTICKPKLIPNQNNRKSDLENRISEIKKLVVQCAIGAWQEYTIAALGWAYLQAQAHPESKQSEIGS